MLLTIIVPVSRMAGRLQNLKSWIDYKEVQNLKVIIIHDIQDEETESELKNLLEKSVSKNISMISGKYGGPGAARNAGMESISTPWFAFWDSDDCPIVTGFLAMVSKAEENNADIAIGEFQIRNSTTNRIEYFSVTDRTEIELNLSLNPGLWRMAFKTSKYADLRFPNFRMGEDQCWLSLVNFKHSKIHVHNSIVYEYTKGDTQQLTAMKDSFLELAATGEHLVNSLKVASEDRKTFLSYLLLKQQISILSRGNLMHKIKALRRIYIVFNSKHKSKLFFFLLKALKKKKYMRKPIRVIMNGGLGNQLFQLSAGAYFGNNCPIEIVYIIKDKNADARKNFHEIGLNRKYEIFLSDVRIPFIQHKILNFSLRLSSKVNKSLKPVNLLRQALLRIIEISCLVILPGTNLKIARGLGFFQSIERFSGGATLLGYFQSEVFANSLKLPLQLIEPRDDFNKNTLALAREDASKLNPLVVQIRLGDYAENPQFGKLSKEYFEKTIQAALADSNCKALWLFSDDMALARGIIPSNLAIPVIEMTLEGASPAEVLRVMSLGKAFVISNSTFGWWGAYLASSENKEVRTYYPDPWFKGISSPESLFPSNWQSKPALFE